MEREVFSILYVNIKKEFKDFQLNIEFEAKDEILAILGASGCGKSMTLKCIAGVETPDEGKIVLNDRTLFDSDKNINLSPQERKVGLLFQNYALFPNMTLEENILTGIPKKHPDKIGLLREKIESFSLGGLEKKYPSQLSGGQQQRVALARMLVNSPELILLDEPLSALDTYLRWQMEQELATVLKNQKATSIFVSHNIDEVYRICDRIAVMDKGKIETVSSKEELFKNPSSVNSAVLTGCKNISRVKKIGAHRIYAIDWDLELELKEEDFDNINYIGIRAHHIHLCKDKTCDNLHELTIEDFIEDIFSNLAVLSKSGKAPIYMFLSNDEFAHLKINDKIYINIEKDDILLLK